MIRLQRLFAIAAATALTLPTLASAQGLPRYEGGSRVFVSLTLNGSIHVYDANLEELQPPIVSRGAGPVRMFYKRLGGNDYLFTANSGYPGSTVGTFELSYPLVVESPTSPAHAPGGFGAVGIGAGDVAVDPADPSKGTKPMVFIGNTYFALAPCAQVPPGSVTGFDASYVASGGPLVPVGTVEISGGLAWGVAVGGPDSVVFASSNCGGTVDVIDVALGGPTGATLTKQAEARPAGRGADGTIYDAERRLNYTVNIGASTLTVLDAASPQPLTTVNILNDEDKKQGPLDLNFATSTAFERDWIVTANGSGNSVGLVDRDAIYDCIAAGRETCDEALVVLLPTGRADGNPEGVDFDPATNRVFVAHKNIPSPSLSYVEITDADGTPGATHNVALKVGGANDPGVPNTIAFDVVVQPR